MIAEPARVGGANLLETDLMTTSRRIVAKEGAEGLLALGSESPALGIAITIEDGDKTRRASAVVALTVLLGLGLLDADDERRLRAAHWPSLVDSVGRHVGEARAVFEI